MHIYTHSMYSSRQDPSAVKPFRLIIRTHFRLALPIQCFRVWIPFRISEELLQLYWSKFYWAFHWRAPIIITGGIGHNSPY